MRERATGEHKEERSMKAKMYVVLGVMAAVAIVTSAHAADEPIRTISVSGTAATRTVPDTIVWRISLNETDKVLVDAKNRSDEKMKSVLDLVNELDVPTEDVQTGRLSIRREYERDERGRNTLDFKHFAVNRSVTFKQSDLERFDEFLTRLVGAADIEASFNFESSQFHEIRADTRLKALRAAKEKAESMCAVLDDKLGRVVTIDEHPRTGGNMGRMDINYPAPFRPPPAEVDVSGGTFAPGAIEIKVTVYATFEID